MGTISVTLPSDGDTIDAADVNNPLNTIVNVINGSLDSNNISDGGITPAELVTGTGSSWAWQTWTPAYANITVGNGTVVSKYIQTGKMVIFKYKLTLGSTSTMGTSMTVSLPVTATSDYDTVTGVIGKGIMYDLSATTKFVTETFWASTTTMQPLGVDSNTAYFFPSATSPFTWTTGDIFYLSGVYEAA